MKFNKYIYILYIFLYFKILCNDIYHSELYTENLNDNEKKIFSKYLGIAYDIIKGNKFGDPKFIVDLGYKCNILKNIKIDFISSKTKNVECTYVPNQSIINNLSDIIKEHNIYKIPKDYKINPSSGSNYYKLLNDRIKKGESVILYKQICSKYKIQLNLENNYQDFIDPFFLNILNRLAAYEYDEFEDEFEDEEEEEKEKEKDKDKDEDEEKDNNEDNDNDNNEDNDNDNNEDNDNDNNEDEHKIKKNQNYIKCDANIYKENIKNKNCKHMQPWINFFNLYGTHFIKGVYFGGRITNLIYSEKPNINRVFNKLNLYKQNLSPFYITNSKSNFGVIISKNTDNIIYLKEKNLILYGGNNINSDENNENLNFEKWKNTIEGQYAKPIKLILIPFSDLINTDEGKTKYYKALEFYSSLNSNYISSIFVEPENSIELIKNDIKNWQQTIKKVVDNDITIYCKNKKNITGFIITKKNKHINLELCSSENCINDIKHQDFKFGYILCGNINKQNVHLKTIIKKNKGNHTLKCPTDMIVAFGFSFIIDTNHHIIIETCKSNNDDCEITKAKEEHLNYTWLNCINKDFKKLTHTFHSKSFYKKVKLKKSKTFRLNCKENTYIIIGFAVDFVSKSDTESACYIGSSYCELKIFINEKENETHIPLIYIVCSSLK